MANRGVIGSHYRNNPIMFLFNALEGKREAMSALTSFLRFEVQKTNHKVQKRSSTEGKQKTAVFICLHIFPHPTFPASFLPCPSQPHTLPKIKIYPHHNPAPLQHIKCLLILHIPLIFSLMLLYLSLGNHHRIQHTLTISVILKLQEALSQGK